VRYRHPAPERLLLVNLHDRSVFPESLPEPLRAPSGQAWRVALDSEAPEFGGHAAASKDWTLHGPGALWLEARRMEPDAAD